MEARADPVLCNFIDLHRVVHAGGGIFHCVDNALLKAVDRLVEGHGGGSYAELAEDSADNVAGHTDILTLEVGKAGDLIVRANAGLAVGDSGVEILQAVLVVQILGQLIAFAAEVPCQIIGTAQAENIVAKEVKRGVLAAPILGSVGTDLNVARSDKVEHLGRRAQLSCAVELDLQAAVGHFLNAVAEALVERELAAAFAPCAGELPLVGLAV